MTDPQPTATHHPSSSPSSSSSSSTVLTALTLTSIILATVLVGLRVFRRATQDKFLPGSSFPRADDFAFPLALLPAWSCAAATLVFALSSPFPSPLQANPEVSPAVSSGGSTEGLALALAERQLRALLAAHFTWAAAMFALRAAVMLQVRRVFIWPWVRPVLAALQGVNGALLVASLVALGLQCRPLSAFCAITGDGAASGSAASGSSSEMGREWGICANSPTIQRTLGALSLFMSAVTFTLSPAIIHYLQATLRRNAAMVALYLLGWVSVGLGIARVVLLPHRSSIDTVIENGVVSDRIMGPGPQSDVIAFLLLNTLEPSVGLSLATIPTIRKLFVGQGWSWRGEAARKKIEVRQMAEARRLERSNGKVQGARGKGDKVIVADDGTDVGDTACGTGSVGTGEKLGGPLVWQSWRVA